MGAGLLVATGGAGYLAVERGTKTLVAGVLEATLRAEVSSLDSWLASQKDLAAGMARMPRTRTLVAELVALAQEPSATPEKLKESAPLRALREELSPIVAAHGYVGFVVTDRRGVNVGALLEAPVGKRTLWERSDTAARAMAGETVVSKPFNSEVPLPAADGTQRYQPTMFVSTPVRDEAGQIVAALSLRIRPAVAFTRSLDVAGFGRSGETYAFDADGWMLSESRFQGGLKAAGLLPDRPEASAIVHVHVRDPGGNLVEGHRSSLPRERQPLTRAAAAAISGQSGLDVDGYRNYLGVEVIGAWAWLPNAGFGVVAEMDVEEAFRSVSLTRNIFAGLFILVVATAGVIAVLAQRQARLHELVRGAATQWQVTLDSIESPVLVVGTDGAVARLNYAAARLAGRTYAECIGLDVRHLGENQPWRCMAEQTAGLRDHGARSPSLQVRDEQSGKIWEVTTSLLNGQHAQVGRFVIVARNVTETARLEACLREKGKIAALGLLVAGVAHEVRNPLFAMSAALETLEEGAEPASSLQILHEELDRLKRLMEDLLEYGRPPRELHPGDPAGAVSDAIRACARLARDAGVALEPSTVPPLPTLLLDGHRLSQAFQNLLQNAIQHSPRGGRVEVTFEVTGQDGEAALECRVRDSGPGFREDDLPKLFLPFFAQRATGIGLGLSIVKQIVDQHRGQITLANGPAGGAVVSMSFPVHPSGRG